ncbi:putative late blight resistance protein homolog R1A-10 [Andrographis paniculata]|uniref:putative late blight resistance protein homolog R1A-10 n=1 Tax=Andrographis paniculata TaxID=175694 RepID=UPI0021E8157E|nr:putative late blight resistance protein homolog R1A-10 [Andrographis paniculata]
MALAAVLSAKHKLNLLFESSRRRFYWEKMSFIHYRLQHLESVTESRASMRGRELRFDPLEQQIEDAANKIADLVESRRASDLQSQENPKDDDDDDDNPFFFRQLFDLGEELSSFSEKIRSELPTTSKEIEQAWNYLAETSSTICYPRVESGELVGLKDELRQLTNWLTGGPDELQVITVAGMAGIGKTTLVQQAYTRPSIVSHFDTRVMVTVGPKFSLQELLMAVSNNLVVDLQVHSKLSDRELQSHVCRFLEQRRYLIVLDDVWHSSVLFPLEECFPKNFTRSRIVVTSRVNRGAPVLKKGFLDDEDSWRLLRRMVFGQDPRESCSFELEKVGRDIAKNCEGLPLAIVLVGKLLCRNERAVEIWKKVAEDENPLGIGIDSDSPISKSLSLSYGMLFRYLKSCFLYTGVFPQSYKIFTSELLRLWTVEGLVTPNRWPQEELSVEETSELWLDKLISQSVVLAQKKSLTLGKTKACRIHVVFRNLCISIAEKEKFCHVLKKYAYSFPRGTNHHRRLCIHNNVMLAIKEVRSTMESIAFVRSLLCLGLYHSYPLRIHLNFGRLEVVNALTIRFYTFPCQILELVCLKYLAVTYDGELPNSISRLRNLEDLIIRRHFTIKHPYGAVYLPVSTWDLKQLRHLRCRGFDLPESCTNSATLEHLLSVLGVTSCSCTDGVLARIRKVRKLGVRIELAPGKEETFQFLGNVDRRLRYLSSFKCVVSGLNSRVVSEVPDFPQYVRKLTLSGCKLPWKSIAAIGKLPFLYVLKLRCNAFHGWSVWEPCDGGFRRLESLLLDDMNLEVWISEHSHFPRLKRLIIRHCYKLHEIPLCFGDMESLEMIEVEDGRPSLAESATHIMENHRRKFGCHHLQVIIHSSWGDKEKA